MFSEQDLSKILSDVEKEFSSLLAKADTEEVTLSKAEDESKEKDEKKDEKPEAPAKEEQKEEAAHSEDEAAAPSQDAPTQDAAPAQDEQAQGEPAQEEGHGYDDEDMKHMQEMYMSMSKAELLAHHDAVRAALDACTEKEGDMSAGQAPAAQAQAPAMTKSEETETIVEVKPEIVQPTQETELLKSEVAAKSAEVEKLQKTLEAVTQFVTKLVEKKAAPAGKAITHLETIAKSEETVEQKPLSKQEITAKLTEKASDQTLKKSDREAINQYYASGQININAISHLLK